MPRVLKIDSMTHRPICKSAGAGGFLGTSVNIMRCHNKARVGLSNQCFRCNIPFFEDGRSINKMVGACSNTTGYACGQRTGPEVIGNGTKGFQTPSS